MAVTWEEAPAEVVALAEKLIDKHHPDLLDARIGLLMRSEAPKKDGKATYGKAKKVSDELKALLPFDFLIWFAADVWDAFSTKQRTALVDHELCHCRMIGGSEPVFKMRGHDVEEFNCIIERYGAWWPSAEQFETAVQAALPINGARRGKVEAVDMKRIFRGVKEGMESKFDNVEVTFGGMEDDDRPFPTTAVDA
jgi:hypothetical protein